MSIQLPLPQKIAMPPVQLDTLIHNGTVITVNAGFDVFDDGIVGIQASQIAMVGPRVPGQPLPRARNIVDARGGLVLPGLINTHTHLPMTLFRGLADDLPLKRWLNDYIFPAEAHFITPQTVQRGTRLACAELLLSGTTTCCDGYFLEDTVARTVAEIGIRAVLGQGVVDFPVPGVAQPADNVTHAAHFLKRWCGANPLIVPAVFCHAPYTCTPQTLVQAKALADSLGVLFQIHTAETRLEGTQIPAGPGISPIQYLENLAVLDANTLLVHAVWVDDRDLETIARRRAAVSHNPESNMKLAAGIAPVPEMLSRGIRVGLGTDGCASNNTLDLFATLAVAAKLHKVALNDPTVMDATTVLKLATIGGAGAIGLADQIGSLEHGKQADIIVIDMNQPHLVPVYHPVSHIAYAVRGSDVRHVWVAGRWLVKERRLMSIALTETMEAVESTAARIRRFPTPAKNP